MDLFWYRTCGVIEFVIRLMDVEHDELENWRIPNDEEVTVSNGAYVSSRPLLRVEFRYVTRKSEQRSCTYWSEQVHQQRRCRSMLRFLEPFKLLTAYLFRDGKKSEVFVLLPMTFSGIEVPQCFQFERAAKVSYI